MNLKETLAVAAQMRKDSTMAYAEGVRYALDYLREVYGEGIEETDIWKEYISE